MKRTLIAFLLMTSLSVFAQRGGHGGGGGMGGRPAGVGSGAGGDSRMGHGATATPDSHPGRPTDTSRPAQQQQTLKDSQINGGAFKMLENKTGMTSDQLKAIYASSGAKNFGQFVSAVVVSKNLGLDTNKVLDGLKTGSLGQTLQNLGVPEAKAKDAIKTANGEAKDAKKHS